jgi:hypothetical protein
VGQFLAPLEGLSSEAVHHRATRLGNGMAAAAGTRLDLQEVHRVFGGQRSVKLVASMPATSVLGATGQGPRLRFLREGVRLRATPRSAVRAASLARVSEKREYFKCRPETIGDFAPKLFKLGV